MKHLKNHVSAAKEWLGRAERSLENDNEIQGNLNLMLAQAELRHAKETTKPKIKWYLLIHSMLITCIVGMVLVIGFGGFDVSSGKVAEKIPMSHIEVKQNSEISLPMAAKEESPQKNNIRTDEEKQAVEVIQPKVIVEEHPLQVNDNVREVHAEEPVRQELNVTPVQMQQLLRAAGKSLRGNNNGVE